MNTRRARIISQASFWRDQITKRRPLRFIEVSSDWKAASQTIRGYEDEEIISSVVQSTRAVRSGQAAFERDGVLFESVQYVWPVLSGLLWAKARCADSLRVLDFGGALGSHFWQYRQFLDDLPDTQWAVVEQHGMVTAGNREFSAPGLTFHESVAEASRAMSPNIVLASGSLCYVSEPDAILDSFAKSGAEVLVLDRVPVHGGQDTVLAKQQLGRGKTTKGYLAWIMSQRQLLERISTEWNIVTTFPSLDRDWKTNRGRWFHWMGLLATRKT